MKQRASFSEEEPNFAEDWHITVGFIYIYSLYFTLFFQSSIFLREPLTHIYYFTSIISMLIATRGLQTSHTVSALLITDTMWFLQSEPWDRFLANYIY